MRSFDAYVSKECYDLMDQNQLSKRVASNTRKDRIEGRREAFNKRRYRRTQNRLISFEEMEEQQVGMENNGKEQIQFQVQEQACYQNHQVGLGVLQETLTVDFFKFSPTNQLNFLNQIHTFLTKCTPQTLSQLLQTNILPTLCTLFTDPSTKLLGDQAASILAYISSRQFSYILASENIISNIILYMKDFDLIRKREAVQILGNLSCDSEDTRKIIRGCGGTKGLLEIIKNSQGNEELVGSACWAIANLIQDEGIPAEITDEVLSILPFVVGNRFLKNEQDLIECLRVLSYVIIPWNYNCSQIVSSKVVTVMGELLMNKKMETATFCMLFLAQVVSVSTQAALQLSHIKFYRCVDFYINLADNCLRFSCLRIITAIAAASPGDSYSFTLNSGLNQTLVRLMREGKTQMQKQVQLLLLEMVHYKTIKIVLPELNKHGYFEGLVDNLGNQHNHALVEHTLLVLKELMVKADDEADSIKMYLDMVYIQSALENLVSHSQQDIAQRATQLLDEYFSE